MSESSNEIPKHTFLSLLGRKGFRTLSPVRRKALLLQLRSKNQGVNPPQNSSNSSKESSSTGESDSLPSHLKTSLEKLGTQGKLLFELGKTKIANNILNYRNRAPKILVYPDPKLKIVAKEVNFDRISKLRLTQIVRKMGAALSQTKYGEKLGIAATQIGIPLRIMIVHGVVIINPIWTPSKAPRNQMVEGCYSVPDQFYSVERDAYGWAKFYSIDGELREFKLNGVNATIFQHEISHLNGECLPDYGIEIKNEKI